MVLDSLGRELAVSDSHDDARLGRGRHLEDGREREDVGGQGVVPGRLKLLRKVEEETSRVVGDERCLAVDDLSGEGDLDGRS